MIVALLVACGALAALAAPQLPHGGWPWAVAFALAPFGFTRLRHSLTVSAIAAFLAATILPFAAATWSV